MMSRWAGELGALAEAAGAASEHADVQLLQLLSICLSGIRAPYLRQGAPASWLDAGRAGGAGMAFKAAAGYATGGRSAGRAARSEPLIGLGD